MADNQKHFTAKDANTPREDGSSPNGAAENSLGRQQPKGNAKDIAKSGGAVMNPNQY
jgi:hypothetical protein